MADFASLAEKMDAQVDARLGDSILYKRAGLDADFVPHKAFLIFGEQIEGGYNPARSRGTGAVCLKVARSIVPRPSMNDRVKTDPALPGPQLDGIYRPLGSDPVVDGRYWIVDLQKAT